MLGGNRPVGSGGCAPRVIHAWDQKENGRVEVRPLLAGPAATRATGTDVHAPRREKADRLVEESRARAQKIQKIKLPRVNVLDDTLDALSPKDRESLERKYKEVRDRTLDSFRKLSQKWEEE